MTHWSEAYIGAPWEAQTHDCWGFARRVWRERFALEVPAVDVNSLSVVAAYHAFRDSPELAQWRPVDTPEEGDAVLLGKGTRPAHVGLWLAVDGGGVLHALENVGVIFTPVNQLAGSGWNFIAYYRRAAQ